MYEYICQRLNHLPFLYYWVYRYWTLFLYIFYSITIDFTVFIILTYKYVFFVLIYNEF